MKLKNTLGWKFIISSITLSFWIVLFFAPGHIMGTNQQLKINLIGMKNGKGLETDFNILQEALEKLDCHVRFVDLIDTKWSKADVNIFLERLVPEKFFWAKQNWFIPNPEWTALPIPFPEKIDLVLCRTKEVQRIFHLMHMPTYYLGFTSPDCYVKKIKKNYQHFFHLAGGSSLKGTAAISQLWFNDSSLPFLTVVNFTTNFKAKKTNLDWISNRLPEKQLRQFQNECGIHLCPSETEGFGHYINEAMSAGAVIITTNAPPMNEFIKDPRCLVPYVNITSMNLGDCYAVDPNELKIKIESLNSLPRKELKAIGQYNRLLYLENREAFYERLQELISLIEPLTEINLDL